MSIQIDRIKVFIARPNDAEREAELAKSVCRELNDIVGGDTFELDAYTYKDLPPSSGKAPQKIINEQLVNKSDIIVYILKKSIGSGGFKSEISSGFKRAKKESVPLLFFEYDLPQLSKKEDKARKELIKPYAKKMLYCTIKTDEELRIKLSQGLRNAVEEVRNANTKKGERAAVKESGISSLPKKNKSVIKKGGKKEQDNVLSVVLSKTGEALKSKIELDDFETSRLFFHSLALLSNKRISTEVLDNHSINLLYKYKEKVIPIKGENDLIFRSLISDIYHQKAGWYWLKFSNNFKFIVDYSFYLVHRDLSEDVINGALEIIDKYLKDDDCKFLKKPSQLASENIKIKIIRVMKNHPSQQSLEIIEGMLNDADQNVKNEAYDTKLKILSKIDTHQAIEFILSDKNISIDNVSEEIYTKANDAELERMLKHDNKSIKNLAFRELVRRDKYSPNQLISLLKDSIYETRYIAIKSLVEKKFITAPVLVTNLLKSSGEYISYWEPYREEDIIKILLNDSPNEIMESYFEWGLYGHLAYEIYALRNWSLCKEEVRKDLKEGFRNRKNEFTKQTIINTGMSETQVEDLYTKHGVFLTDNYIRAGLKVLLEKGEDRDKSIAYQYIETDAYGRRDICEKILMKYGNNDDSVYLYERSTRSNKVNKMLLTKALDLDGDNSHNLLEKSIKSKNHSIYQTALSYCYKNKIKLSKPIEKLIESQLYNEDYEVRKLSLAFIINARSKIKLKTLLKKYNSETTYYYNVVSYLDTYLYTNPIMKKQILNELTNNLSNI